MEDDDGLFNQPSDPKRQKLENEAKEEKDSGTLSSLDDLKAIRKKIQEYIEYWKQFPYEKRSVDPWNFNHSKDLDKIFDDYMTSSDSLAASTTEDILEELKLFMSVIDVLDKERWVFIKFLHETYIPQRTLNLVKLYKLGIDEVVEKIDEDVLAGKPDRNYLLEVITEQIEPVWQNKDLEDTTDETYEDLVEALDKVEACIGCCNNFVDGESQLVARGTSLIWSVGFILKRMRGVDVYKTLGFISPTEAAANMRV